MPEPLFPWSLVVIGTSTIAAGVIGALLPSGQRLESLLALVAGAGSGVLVLALGVGIGLDTSTPETMDRLFFAGSCFGAATVGAVLVAIRRRALR